MSDFVPLALEGAVELVKALHVVVLHLGHTPHTRRRIENRPRPKYHRPSKLDPTTTTTTPQRSEGPEFN